MSKNRKKQIIFAILCAVFALATFATVFLPAIRHQKPDNSDVGLGDFKVMDIIKGGLYDYENDKKDESTGELIKYNKLSEKAQYYYQTFILLDEARAGSLFAVFLMLTLVCALLMFASAIVSIGAGSDSFILQMALGLLHVGFTCACLFSLPSLASLVANDIFITLNFTVVGGIALPVLLVSGIGFTVCAILCRLASGKKLFKTKK